MGLRDMTGFGYSWVTGERVVAPMRDFTSPLPPGNCATNIGATGAWAAAACSTLDGSICENPGWSIEPKRHHAYRPFFDQPSWTAAPDACAQRGAHLATLTDQDDPHFV